MIHFDWFCRLDTDNHCDGNRIIASDNSKSICFKYDEKKYTKGPKDFFLSYPILKFKIKTSKPDEFVDFEWFPSEYLYRDKID